MVTHDVSAIAKHNTPFALIGLARSGKDYLIGKTGRKSIGLSDPIAALMERFAGGAPIGNKSSPGYRRVMQLWGQWGRGMLTEEYPLTPERLQWLQFVRSRGIYWAQEYALDLGKLGFPQFWIEGAVDRVRNSSSTPTAISNLRWPADVNGVPLDWPIVLVVREPHELRTSMAACGESVDVWNDTSERLASGLTVTSMRPTSFPTGLLADVWDRIDGVFFNGNTESQAFFDLRDTLAKYPNKRLFVDRSALPEQAAAA